MRAKQRDLAEWEQRMSAKARGLTQPRCFYMGCLKLVPPPKPVASLWLWLFRRSRLEGRFEQGTLRRTHPGDLKKGPKFCELYKCRVCRFEKKEQLFVWFACRIWVFPSSGSHCTGGYKLFGCKFPGPSHHPCKLGSDPQSNGVSTHFHGQSERQGSLVSSCDITLFGYWFQLRAFQWRSAHF